MGVESRGRLIRGGVFLWQEDHGKKARGLLWGVPFSGGAVGKRARLATEGRWVRLAFREKEGGRARVYGGRA